MTFDEFATAHVRWLLGLATAMSGDRPLAEDLVQEVLLKTYQRWNKIENMDVPTQYVRRMLINEHLSWRRKWARVMPFAELELVDDAPDHATSKIRAYPPSADQRRSRSHTDCHAPK